MDDSKLRSMRADVEANVDVPDFDVVAARGRRIQRRRTVAVGAVGALAVAVVAVGVNRTFDDDRSGEPVQQPAPSIDPQGARRVLTDPRAEVDSDASKVNGAGDMLAVVAVPESGDACPGAGGTALRWSGRDGQTRSWVDRYRLVHALPAGFVVAAVPGSCRSDDPLDGQAYLVDADGIPRDIDWADGAQRLCAAEPADPRCEFDVDEASGGLGDGTPPPDGAELLPAGPDGHRWARSADGRTVFWSANRTAWERRTTSLSPGAIVSASAAGRWAVLAGSTSVEFTSDAGASWQSRDLSAALRSIRIGDVDWTVTRTGVLLGVTALVGRGDVLFRSTDASWTRFVETDVRTSFGLVRPVVEGGAAYVVDDERWAVSTDDGATWRRTPALP